jgi:hypothetical protein
MESDSNGQRRGEGRPGMLDVKRTVAATLIPGQSRESGTLHGSVVQGPVTEVERAS